MADGEIRTNLNGSVQFVYPADVQERLDSIAQNDLWPAVQGTRSDYEAIHIDGRITTYGEFVLFRVGLQTLAEQKLIDGKSQLLQTIMEEGYYGVYSLSDTLPMMPTGNEAFHLSTALRLTNQNLAALQAFKSRLTPPNSTVAVDYLRLAMVFTINELAFAAQHDKPLVFQSPLLINEGVSRTTLRSDLAKLPIVAQEDLAALHGEIVDAVLADDPASAPTVYVFLDWHSQIPLAESNMYDIALLQKYGPINTLEGVNYGEDAARFFSRRYLGKSVALCFDELELPRPQSFDDAVKDRLKASRDHLRCETGLSAMGLIDEAKLKNKFPDENQAKIEEVLYHWASMGEQISFPTYAYFSETFYHKQIPFVGWESEVANFHQYFGIVENRARAGQPQEYYLSDDIYTTQWRSQVALDNTVTLAEGTDNRIATELIGADHFESTVQYAKDRRDVNVVFIAPRPYYGPMLTLPDNDD